MINCKEVKEKIEAQIEEDVQNALEDLTVRFEKRLKQTIRRKEETMEFIVGEVEGMEIPARFLQLLIDNGYTVFSNKARGGGAALKISGWIL